MIVRFSRAAKDDLIETLRFLDQQGPRRGTKFRAELRRCLQQIKATPLAWPRLTKRVRLRIMKKFKFGIYYEYMEANDEIVVGAFMFLGRDSHGWEQRF